ncbi:MAG: hypothetical protein JWR07_1371 [Nevskia sp.]|nr:hypothetical protein [Nevskia sp.]
MKILDFRIVSMGSGLRRNDGLKNVVAAKAFRIVSMGSGFRRNDGLKNVVPAQAGTHAELIKLTR